MSRLSSCAWKAWRLNLRNTGNGNRDEGIIQSFKEGWLFFSYHRGVRGCHGNNKDSRKSYWIPCYKILTYCVSSCFQLWHMNGNFWKETETAEIWLNKIWPWLRCSLLTEKLTLLTRGSNGTGIAPPGRIPSCRLSQACQCLQWAAIWNVALFFCTDVLTPVRLQTVRLTWFQWI